MIIVSQIVAVWSVCVWVHECMCHEMIDDFFFGRRCRYMFLLLVLGLGVICVLLFHKTISCSQVLVSSNFLFSHFFCLYWKWLFFPMLKNRFARKSIQRPKKVKRKSAEFIEIRRHIKVAKILKIAWVKSLIRSQIPFAPWQNWLSILHAY